MNKLMNQLPEFLRANKFYVQKFMDEFGKSDENGGGEVLKKRLKETYGIDDTPVESAIQQANLISSEAYPATANSMAIHYPILDLDFPVELRESSTKGHYHLYLGKALTTSEMDKLVTVLYDIGYLQHGVYQNQWKKHKALFLRLPWVKKGDNLMSDKDKADLIAKVQASDAKEDKPDETVKVVNSQDYHKKVLEFAKAFKALGMETTAALKAARDFVDKYESTSTEVVQSQVVTTDLDLPW